MKHVKVFMGQKDREANIERLERECGIAEKCPYFIICERQYGTQQCSGYQLQCSRYESYLQDGTKTDNECDRDRLLKIEHRI